MWPLQHHNTLCSRDPLGCGHSESMCRWASESHDHPPATPFAPVKWPGCPKLTLALWPQSMYPVAGPGPKLGSAREGSYPGRFYVDLRKGIHFSTVLKPHPESWELSSASVKKPMRNTDDAKVRDAEKVVAAFWSLIFVWLDIQLKTFLSQIVIVQQSLDLMRSHALFICCFPPVWLRHMFVQSLCSLLASVLCMFSSMG